MFELQESIRLPVVRVCLAPAENVRRIGELAGVARGFNRVQPRDQLLVEKSPRLVSGQPPMRSKISRGNARLAWTRPVASSRSRRPVELPSTNDGVDHRLPE